MDSLTIAAASGLRSRLEALDLLANNLANQSSPGFKADRESYGIYLSEASAAAEDDGSGAAQGVSPVLGKQWTDFQQGALQATGNPNDVALSGSGFLLAQSPNGPVLFRSGELQVTKEGKLATREGYEVAVNDPKNFRLDPSLAFSIDQNGMVWQNNIPVGEMKKLAASNAVELSHREGGYFALDTRDLPKLTPSQAGLKQGYIEGSNLGPADAAVRMVGILRQFESLQKASQLGSEMNRHAIEEVARV